MKASEPRSQTLDETGPATVLVVDDSELSRAVIVRQLERHGLRVLQAGDGAEGAVVALRELPDVVVTDLEMPVMDGYQLARLLKNDPSTCHIALVILTSHSEAASRFWGLETGADAFLRLPVAVRVLVAHVISVLRRQARATTAAADHLPGFLADHGWQFDATRRRLVGPNEQAIALTATEVRILDTLAAYPDRALDRTSLSARALGRELTGRSRTMDMLVSRLRKKLRGTGTSARALQVTAAYGKGYRLSWATPADC